MPHHVSKTAQEKNAAQTAAEAVAAPAPQGTAAIPQDGAYRANATLTRTALRGALDLFAIQAISAHGKLQLGYRSQNLELKKLIGCMTILLAEILI